MISKHLLLSCFMAITLTLSACATVPSVPANGSNEVPLNGVDQNQISNKEKNEFFVFFNNVVKDPNMMDCSSVYPVLRNFNRDTNYEEAIRALMHGPTEEEEIEGYVSSFPTSAELNYVIISGKSAKIDFKTLPVSGSCATLAVRAQITETLQQFPGVEEVLITVKMTTEGVLEP